MNKKMEASKTIPGKATIYIEEDNILNIKMLKNSNIDLDTAKEIVKAASDITGNNKHVNLVDIRDMIFISREARVYFAKRERKNVLAIAILKNSVFHNSLVNIYFKINKPRIHTKAFDKAVDAIDWLREKLRENPASKK